MTTKLSFWVSGESVLQESSLPVFDYDGGVPLPAVGERIELTASNGQTSGYVVSSRDITYAAGLVSVKLSLAVPPPPPVLR